MLPPQHPSSPHGPAPQEGGALRVEDSPPPRPTAGPTFGAVLAFPARVTDFFAPLPAGEVAEGVVSGTAEDGAALPVVVLVTHEAVGVPEVGAAAAVQVVGPLLAHRQVPLRGQAADEPLWVFYGKMVLPSVLT